MTSQLAPISCWYTDTGIAIAITKPGASPNDTATVATMPFEYARDVFLTSVLQALHGHEEHRKLGEATDAAIAQATLELDTDDDPQKGP